MMGKWIIHEGGTEKVTFLAKAVMTSRISHFEEKYAYSRQGFMPFILDFLSM